MSNFEFYKSTEVYREKYFQLPQIFFTSEKYRSMSNDAKIAYTLLKDRFDYSIQNNWVDGDDNIYFIFTVVELMDLLNCREGKVSKIKKELEACGLLFQKRQPPKIVNGQKEGQPNYLYLGKPAVAATDVFQTDSLAPVSQIAKIAIQENRCSDGLSPQIAKIAIQENPNADVASSQIAEIANNLFKTSLDTLNTDTLNTDTKKAADFDAELLATFHLTNDQTFLAENTLKFIALFSKTFDQAYSTVGIVQRAKKAAEQQEKRVLVAENWQEELDLQVRKVIQKLRTDHTIQNTDNYLFKTLTLFFVGCIRQEVIMHQNKSVAVIYERDRMVREF
ncbi:replication initiator protein A [Enterococcus sp. LJL90]